MTTDNQEPTGPVIFQVAVCGVCDALFLMSGRRQTSPCHGSDPVLIVATLDVEPDGDVTGTWGLADPARAVDITPQPEEPAPPPEPAPAEEEPEGPPPGSVSHFHGLTLAIEKYLFNGGANEEDVRQAFLKAGAEPEAAATAVGRLQAVNVLMEKLGGLGVAATVGVTAEETPPEAPEPPSTPESVPEPS